MERQTKHRILGIFVIIGLVIILLPLFQANKDLTTEAALVKAPPFPDQSVQVTATTSGPSQLTPAQESAGPQPIPSLPQASERNSNQLPDDVINATHPSVVNTQNSITPSGSNASGTVQIQLTHNDVIQSEMAANKLKSSEQPTTTNSGPIKTTRYRIIEGDKAASLLKKTARLNHHNTKTQTIASIKTPMNLNTPIKTPIDDDGLIKLKSAVWVIQIGSFKNKTNALRIVNELRANGYRAFIQQISTALGDNTRVFVGPEHKRTTARALADRLQSEMHIQGIVISYKPLTL